MIPLSSMRGALQEVEKEVSRRAFLKKVIKGAAAATALDRFGAKLFGAEIARQADGFNPAAVFSAAGNLVIPVDEDPGWATFEPEITQYGMNVTALQLFLGGNRLAFQGFLGTLVAFNEMPPAIGYAPMPFLQMTESAQAKYFADALTGQFENDGVQDLLGVAAFLSLASTKATFFSNFPRHLATPGAEFQILPASRVKTGWDIMGFRGPIGAEEEKALREKYYDIEVLPGIDRRNPYI